MKHVGKARRAGLRLLFWSLILLAIVLGGLYLTGAIRSPASAVAGTVIGLWLAFAIFCVSFFRDPTANVPKEPGLIVAPGHGKVDVIGETTEMEVMGGRCRRVSIFLSVADVHVQNAPLAGEVIYQKHCSGKFLNALNTECGTENENVLVGFRPSERPNQKIALRLIAGLIARRIVPWTTTGDRTERGERISLIQFGSRVDLYLPFETEVTVSVGDRVKGGETVVARWV
jgi:phosphatidylserine decarboxylase